MAPTGGYHITEALNWRGNYQVPDIQKEGKLVPLKKGVRFTTDFHAADTIIVDATQKHFTCRKAMPSDTETKTDNLVRDYRCPSGRTDGKVWAKIPDDDEEGDDADEDDADQPTPPYPTHPTPLQWNPRKLAPVPLPQRSPIAVLSATQKF